MYKFYHALPPSANKMQIYSPKFTTHLLNSQTWVNPFFRPVYVLHIWNKLQQITTTNQHEHFFY